MKDLTYQTLVLEQPGEHVLTVRINRPEVRNAISTQVGADLHDVFTRLINAGGDYRCVILTGTGDKAFCAGGDLKERNGMTDAQWMKQHALFERMTLSLLDCPIPLIGAVNGAAFATRQAKRSMHYGMQMDLRSALFFEIDVYNKMVTTEDRLEGVRAFNEKRKPNFKGR